MKYIATLNSDDQYEIDTLQDLGELVLSEATDWTVNNLQDQMHGDYSNYEEAKNLFIRIESILSAIKNNNEKLILNEAKWFNIRIKEVEKMFTITESEYRMLLTDSHMLSILESDGVDNWEYYMEERRDYVADWLNVSLAEVDKRDLGIEDIVDAEIKERINSEE